MQKKSNIKPFLLPDFYVYIQIPISDTNLQLNAEVIFCIPKFIVSLHQQNQKQI